MQLHFNCWWILITLEGNLCGLILNNNNNNNHKYLCGKLLWPGCYRCRYPLPNFLETNRWILIGISHPQIGFFLLFLKIWSKEASSWRNALWGPDNLASDYSSAIISFMGSILTGLSHLCSVTNVITEWSGSKPAGH